LDRGENSFIVFEKGFGNLFNVKGFIVTFLEF